MSDRPDPHPLAELRAVTASINEKAAKTYGHTVPYASGRSDGASLIATMAEQAFAVYSDELASLRADRELLRAWGKDLEDNVKRGQGTSPYGLAWGPMKRRALALAAERSDGK